MKKTDAELLLKRSQRQISNTSAGGQLGGTNHGQVHGSKLVSSPKGQADKGRKSGAKT